MEITAQTSLLVRQHFARNLNDRMHTRPFLSLVDKKWLAFQVICAVCQAHSAGVVHGDLKTENVFVSSWNHAILTDFATFKPLMLPQDDPSEFSFFFESDRNRHRCYLAPERFDGAGSSMASAPRGRFSLELAAMDIFSLGCVLAEVFLDGQTLLDLPQLRAYRQGETDVREKLAALGDGPVQELISSMLSRESAQRKPAIHYLREWCAHVVPKCFRNCLFPLSVLLMHPVYQQPDMRVALLRKNFATILWSVAGRKAVAGILNQGRERVADESTSKLWDAWYRRVERRVCSVEEVMHAIVGGSVLAASQWTAPEPSTLSAAGKCCQDSDAGIGTCKSPMLAQPQLREEPCQRFSTSLFSLWEEGCRRCISSGQIDEGENQSAAVYESFLADLCAGSAQNEFGVPHPPSFGEDEEGAFSDDSVGIVCSFICSCAQHVSIPRVRIACLDMLEMLAALAPQDTILEQIVPYSHVLMTDPVAKVRARAVDVLTRTLGRVQQLPASNAPLFMEYIFPQLMSAIGGMNNEPVVLLAVARNIGTLACQAKRFAELSAAAAQQTATPGGPQPTSGSTPPIKRSTDAHAAVEIETFDVQCKHLQEFIKKIVKALLENLPMAGTHGPNLVDRPGASSEEEVMANLAVGREVKIALLRNMCVLAESFGRDGTHNFLLPYLISFMNDPAWEVRAAFCEEAALLPKKVGQVSSEGIIWPCYEQALLDQEERVLEAALRGLTVLAAQEVLRRQSLVTVTNKVAPLLVHPSDLIRKSAAEAISSLAAQMSPVDQHVFLMPAVRPFLRLQACSLSALTASLLSSPLSRHTFKRVLLGREEGLHEALLTGRPLPRVPGIAGTDGQDESDRQLETAEIFSSDQEAPDVASLEQLRPYMQLLLRSRQSKAPSAGSAQREEFTAQTLPAGKVQSLQYATVNPNGVPNRSLAALAEASSSTCQPWPPPAPRGLRHPLGFFSMQAYLAKAFCLPPRPCDLGSLSCLDGTPYSIYALSSASATSTSVSSSIRPEASADGFELRIAGHADSATLQDSSGSGGQDLCDSAEATVDALTSSMMGAGSERLGPAPPAFRGMWPRTSESVGAIDMEGGSSRASGLHQATWKPKGHLLATLYEYAHQSGVPVVKVDTTDDSRILVTGGRDGVVKIWSCAQLERDTAVASAHTFTLPARANTENQRQRLRALRTVRNSKGFAIGTHGGEVLLYKVEPSRSGASAVQTCRFATGNPASSVMCIEQFDTELESLVVFAQEHGAIHGWDVRGASTSWSLQQVPAWLGVPNCLALGSDGHSAIVGTMGGGLLVYDLRYLTPWKQWKVSSGAAVLSLKSADFGTSQGAFVALGSECNEVALFDVSRGSCLTLFLTEPVGGKQKDTAVSVPKLLQIPTPSEGNIVDDSASAAPRSTSDNLQPLLTGGRKGGGSVRSLWLPPRGAPSFLLAAGADRKVRHWSLDPERHAAEAYVVTPSESPGLDRDKTTYNSNHLGDVFVVQEQEPPSAQNQDTWSARAGSSAARGTEDSNPSAPSSNHRDAILDMCTISLQHDILVTAGRDGLVKLWR
eukprot:TRINITY_DN20965_c0_g1_i1.p1 TRINITY_DN20965_c0_g1~~TRINITY_DN20965_c0_g1_i1.p1  ORF type:complete len:1650 (-),score=327.44 TRINITY_DN20965_c0_g1_i1:54-4712(-)